MRLAFLGTPEAAVASLRALVDAGHEIVVVVTRPDRRRGRGSALAASPVKLAALELGLRVEHGLGALEGLELDRGVVVAYGAMIPSALLARVPMLNVHFSLLPRWRGAAPVERAILAGDEFTGVSVMTLEVTLDTGPVHARAEVGVDDKTASQLMAELADLGARLVVDVLASPTLLEGPHAQEGEPTYAEKLSAATFHLVPSMSAEVALRTVRLERAFTIINGRRLKVLAAHAHATPQAASGSLVGAADQVVLVTHDGALALDEVQPEGGRRMSAAAWWAGARLEGTSPQWG